MAKKELSIILRAVNEASGTLGAVRNQLGNMGAAAEKADKQSTGLFGRMINFATSAKGIVAGLAAYFSMRGLVGGLVQTAREMDNINDMATRLGVGVQWLSETAYAAKLAGTELEGLGSGIANAVKNYAQFATGGGGRAADAFRDLGIDLKTANGELLEADVLIDRIMAGLAKVQSNAKQTELAKRIFGDDKFLVFLKDGKDRLAIMRQEAQRLGVSIGPEQAQRAAEFSDSLDRVSFAWTGFKRKTLDRIGPDLTEVMNFAAGSIAAIPAIAGNIFGVIKKYFGDGEESESIRQDVQLLFADLGNVVVEGIDFVFRLGAIALPPLAHHRP